jgi:uncharacterized membrane protein
MNEIIMVLLSMVPGIEAMWSSAYFFCAGQLFYLPLCILLNFSGVVVFIKIMDREMLPERIEKFLEKRRQKTAKRIESWFGRYGNIALFLLIAFPLTGIGSYTGAFIGRIFELKGAKFYLMILLAISFSLVFGFFIGSAFGILFKC